MAFGTATLLNNGQTTNDADGVITTTIPGSLGDIVVLGFAINNGTATNSVSDNGNVSNPWTQLHTTNPDIIQTALDLSLYAKQLGSTDVGKTLTITCGIGGVRLPVVLATFTGRSSVSDIVTVRGTNDVSGDTSVTPASVTAGTGSGWDIVEVFFTRAATAVQTTMSTVPTSFTKRGEAATAFTASPNLSVVVASQDGVASGTYGGAAATFSQAVNQAVGFSLALKQAASTYNKGQFFPFF